MTTLPGSSNRAYDHDSSGQRARLEVVKGLVLRLRQHLENRDDRENAETAFRALFRLTNAEPGRPNYWEFTWENAQIYIERYVPEDCLP